MNCLMILAYHMLTGSVSCNFFSAEIIMLNNIFLVDLFTSFLRLSLILVGEAAKKIFFLVGSPLRGGEGVRDRPVSTKEKNFFF